MSTIRHSVAAALAVAGLCIGATGTAQGDETARVISVTPIYGSMGEPQQQCTTEYPPEQGYRSEGSAPVGTIAGGVIGGVIGHQFGSGRGNTAATIGGAVAGAAIGNQIDRNNAHGNAEQSPQPIERCEPVQGSGEDATAYSVVYDFDGQRFTAQLPYDPGPTLEVDEYGAPLER